MVDCLASVAVFLPLSLRSDLASPMAFAALVTAFVTAVFLFYFIASESAVVLFTYCLLRLSVCFFSPLLVTPCNVICLYEITLMVDSLCIYYI